MLKRIPPFLPGLLLILAYWFWIHPPGFGLLGYGEDGCSDIVRQMMSENLAHTGGPSFRTESFMAPTGISAPYMSWSIERDWLGAYFWKLSPEFPFMWVYFGVSLVLSYLGLGFFMGRMGLSQAARWGLATLAVFFHVPRHFKIYHHFEHLPQHWLYLSIFLDTWIWQRFWSEKKWDWNLELWRGFLLVGTFCGTGYHWPEMILEWAVFRACLLGAWLRFRPPVRLDLRRAITPLALIAVFAAFEYRWFHALSAEASRGAEIESQLYWFAHWQRVFEPLWLTRFADWSGFKMNPIDLPETVVTIGWLFWVPAAIGLWSLRKSRALRLALPHLILLFLIISYVNGTGPVPGLIRSVIPLFSFIRVASRVSLLLPGIVSALIAISWPGIAKGFGARKKKPGFRAALAAFALLSLIEVSWMSEPVKAMPELGPETRAMLEQVRDRPGDTVLDLPFCVAGGNGYCTADECPHYPHSVVGQCLRQWHHKKVFGLYQARMTASSCLIYWKYPYYNWFQAWKERRCFSPAEFTELCFYLKTQPQISSILWYPDIWVGAGTPECFNSFREHFGEPLGHTTIFTEPTRGAKGASPTQVFLFGASCK